MTDFDVSSDVEETTDTHESEGVYANPEKAEEQGTLIRSFRGDSADEVDPRRLFRDPTLSELRWYYRRSDLGGVLVDKPIEDAFKHDFEFEGENSDEAEELIHGPRFEVPNHEDSFIGAHILAEKKARRDGFSLVFMGTRERDTPGPHVSPISEDVNVEEVSHLKVLTIDDLAGGSVPHEQIQEGTGLEQQQYEVRNTGIVVNKDVTSPRYQRPVGYVLDQNGGGQFIHADRALHYTWNPEVDGDYKRDTRDSVRGIARWHDRDTTIGTVEGDSVLLKSYDILKGVSKGNWAIMQALFRNAAHMYTVEMPEDADDEDFSNANQEFSNLNAKSEVVHPHGYAVSQHESGGEMEPREHFDVLFDQICAGHEMTKSVLFGTQTGTVSGSETDIKNYFNQIERYRGSRGENAIMAYLTRAKSMMDSRTADDYEYEGVEIEWGPLFKLDRDTRMGVFETHAQAMSVLIGNYVLTPEEARGLLSEEWAELDLGSMDEEQMDVLDRVNLTGAGQGPSALQSEEEYAEGPESQQTAQRQAGQQSGRQQGQQQAQQNPAADAVADSLADGDFADKVADKVADRLTDGQPDD